MMKFILAAAARLICTTLIVSTSAFAVSAVTLTEAQNGKTVVVDQGASLIISLESNPGTGYKWQIGKNDNAILKFVDQSALPPKTPMPGARGRQMFKFKAIASGNDAFELEYVRPWEKGVAPAKRFGVIVTVK